MNKKIIVIFEKFDKCGNKIGIERCVLANWGYTKKFYRAKGRENNAM